MLHFKKRAVSYIAGRLISGSNSCSVFDPIHSAYFNYSGTVFNNINIYDYTRSSYLTGDSNSIYDYGTGQYISLKIQGHQFSGYDYETCCYFKGSVNGNKINFYDYADGTHNIFSL
jgi:hypothetical protein